MICLPPRSLGDSVRPRRLSAVVVRPLNFTVSRHEADPLDCALADRGSPNLSGPRAVVALAFLAHGSNRGLRYFGKGWFTSLGDDGGWKRASFDFFGHAETSAG